MNENREIQCEYSTTRSNENKCKALEIEFHNCLNILEQKKCPIYKLKQQLKSKEQECEELKDRIQYLINTQYHFKNELKKYKKAVHKYKVILQDKIKRLYLSRREFLKEINSVPTRIACNGEDFKNALNNFNNAIQVITNEDNYKRALKEIEKYIQKGSGYYIPYDVKKVIQIIINRAKEQK